MRKFFYEALPRVSIIFFKLQALPLFMSYQKKDILFFSVNYAASNLTPCSLFHKFGMFYLWAIYRSREFLMLELQIGWDSKHT